MISHTEGIGVMMQMFPRIRRGGSWVDRMATPSSGGIRDLLTELLAVIVDLR